MSKLPDPPVRTEYNEIEKYKDAVLEWSRNYATIYDAEHPVKLENEPFDPGEQPESPTPPKEPDRKEFADVTLYHAALKEWGLANEKWYDEEYLPWEIERTKWYAAFNVRRDWEALKRLENFKHKNYRAEFVAGLLKVALFAVIVGSFVAIFVK